MKRDKGITLIALVITIIVLLILAGVTINAIIGNESSMEKAKQAQVENEKANEFDSIKMAVTDAMVKETDGTIHLDKLNESLTGLIKENAQGEDPWTVTGSITNKMYLITKYGQVEEVKGVLVKTKTVNVIPGGSKEIEVLNITGEELTFTPVSSNGITITKGTGNKVTIIAASTATVGTKLTVTAEAGTENDTFEVNVIEDVAGLINAKIGKNVSYSVTYKDASNNDVTVDKWQVFYADADNNEVFIISENILELNTSIGNSDILSQYSDGASSLNSFGTSVEPKYGRKYNLKWFEVDGMPDTSKYSNGNAYNNSKVVAYLCDSTNPNWSKYANGTFGNTSTPSGIYAVGGPTVELLKKSLMVFDPSKIVVNDFRNQNGEGYKDLGISSGLNEPYRAKYTKNDGTQDYGFWWLASPKKSSGSLYQYSWIFIVYADGSTGGGGVRNSYADTDPDQGVRPVVSIPLDKFDMSWISE